MYHILLNELEKPKFDAYIEGALIDSNGRLSVNIFGSGGSEKDRADKSYSVKLDEDFSKEGLLRDRLLVKVHYSSHLLIVSEEVQKLLIEVAPEQIEFYPFHFKYQDESFLRYKIVNIVNKIDCVDYDKSEIDFETYDDNDVGEGSIFTINSLVLNESVIPRGLKIFLLGRHNDAIIVVEERLKKIIEERELSGFVFSKPEDFKL